MNHRYFRVNPTGPLFAELQRLCAERRKAAEAMRTFLKKHKLTNAYGSSPADYRFDMEVKDRDPKIWSETKPRRGTYYYVPNRRTAEGKAMKEEIAKLPSHPALEESLTMVGLYGGIPVMFSHSTGYSTFYRFVYVDGGIAIISVPWRDEDPKKLAKYKREKAKGTHYSGELDHLLWEPPAELTELKEWEALKIIDETNEALKAKKEKTA